jgi:hypothetical protein
MADLENMLDSKYLGLTVIQVQDNMSLTSVSDPKNLNITKF